MKWSELKGNERAVEYFRKAIANAHLGHAFLFSGPAGLGKATVARLICKLLLCREPSPDGPCENCAACRKFETDNHPDFHTYAPEGLYFKIDQVREIIHQASMKPVESRWKTFLLEGVEYMRDEASNAMLKVLEEPPGQTIFFLLSENVDVLLPTIRSRCQHFPFSPLPPEDIRDWLVRHRGYDPAEADMQARYSQGSIGRALSVNVDQYCEIRERALGALEAALAPRTYALLMDAVKAVTVERTEMPERFLILEELTRDLIVLQASGQARLVHQDVANRLAPLASRVSRPALSDFYEKLLQTREAVLKVNANTGLSLQTLFLSLRAESAPA